MPIGFINDSSNVTTSTQSGADQNHNVTISFPSATQVGDVLVAFCVRDNNIGSEGAWQTATGWTRIINQNGASQNPTAIYIAEYDGTQATTITCNHVTTYNGLSRVSIFRLTGADATNYSVELTKARYNENSQDKYDSGTYTSKIDSGSIIFRFAAVVSATEITSIDLDPSSSGWTAGYAHFPEPTYSSFAHAPTWWAYQTTKNSGGFFGHATWDYSSTAGSIYPESWTVEVGAAAEFTPTIGTKTLHLPKRRKLPPEATLATVNTQNPFGQYLNWWYVPQWYRETRGQYNVGTFGRAKIHSIFKENEHTLVPIEIGTATNDDRDIFTAKDFSKETGPVTVYAGRNVGSFTNQGYRLVSTVNRIFPRWKSNDSWTIVFLVKLGVYDDPGVGVSDPRIFSIDKGSQDSDKDFQLRAEGSSQFSFQCRIDGVTYNNNLGTSTVNVNTVQMVACSFNGATMRMTIIEEDGSLAVYNKSQEGSYNPRTDTDVAVGNGAYGAISQNIDGHIFYIYGFDKYLSRNELTALRRDPWQVFREKKPKTYSFGSTWTAPQKLDISHIVKPTFVPSEKFRQSAILDYNEPLTQGVTFAADLPYDVLVAKTGQASDHSGDYKSYNFRYWTQFRRYKHKRLGMWHSSSELGMMQYLEDSGIILDGYDATVFVDFNFEGDDGGQWCGLVCRREFGLNDGCWQTLHDNTNNYFAYWYQNGGTKSVNFTGIGDAGWVSGDHIRYMLTRNSSNITLYYWNNGVLKIESQTTPAYAHIVGNAQNLSIGNTDTGNRPTHGLFTLTTLWDRCLSEAEAKSYIENPYQIFKARKLTSYSFPSNKPATPTPHGWLQG